MVWQGNTKLKHKATLKKGVCEFSKIKIFVEATFPLSLWEEYVAGFSLSSLVSYWPFFLTTKKRRDRKSRQR